MGPLQRASVARWAPAAGLAVIIVVGATIGFAVSGACSAFGYSVADDPAHHRGVAKEEMGA